MFDTATVSQVGGRNENQDRAGHRVAGNRGCWVVADGLGGHKGGSIASALAVAAILQAYEADPVFSGEALAQYVAAGQKAITDQQDAEPALVSMRTTIVVLLMENGQALWAHAGDTRLYQFRDGRVLAQTVDHSVPQALVVAGVIDPEDIREHPDRNRILRSLGNAEDYRLTVTETPRPVLPGDAFLLCTDGFWEYVWEDEMLAALAETETAEAWLDRMTAYVPARAEPDHDNYTAIAIRGEVVR